MWFDQDAYALRCEWGAAGIAALAPSADVIIIVDVLSFSTCVDVAVSRGAVVYPYRWKDTGAVTFADSIDACLAGPRSREHVSLSPVSLQRIGRGTRIVLPSPNGATLSGLTGNVPTLTGCLRNAAAVARYAKRFGARIGVVPAGEQWPNSTLRPSIEDWLGAGAILSHLSGPSSPEADLARDAFLRQSENIGAILQGSVSGRELIDQGWSDDVTLASQTGASESVPMLQAGAYRNLGDAVDVGAGNIV